jgi:fibronectin-binding autotransporter adhesin
MDLLDTPRSRSMISPIKFSAVRSSHAVAAWVRFSTGIRHAAAITLALMAAAFWTGSARAATDTWIGGGADGNWMTAANWNTLPVASDNLVFDGTTNLTTTNNFAANTQFNGITFNSTAGSFTLGGNAILLAGDINDNSTSAETISLGLVLNGGTSNVNVVSGGSLALGALTFGTPAGSATVSTLNVNSSVTATALTAQTNTASANILNITGSSVMTVNGVSIVGFATSITSPTPNTALTITGNELDLNNTLTVGQNESGASTRTNNILDMSGLSTFKMIATGTGQAFNAATATQANGTVTLAKTSNLINTLTINLGSTTSNAGTGTLNLGGGTNTLEAATFNVGTGKGTGIIQFSGTGGSVTIAGTNGTGAVTTMNFGRDTSSTSSSSISSMSLAGHMATVSATTITVGTEAGNSGGTGKGNITFDTGTFNVANLLMAIDSSGSSALGSLGAFYVGGTAYNPAATGILNVTGSLVLANNTNATAAGPTAGAFVVNGATANVGSDITVAGTQGTRTTSVVLAGGTLNMQGHAIGSSAAPITNIGLTLLNDTATLENLGGAGINGAGLTLGTQSFALPATVTPTPPSVNYGAGTLILDGTNTYTGGTNINSGTLRVASTGTLGGGAAVAGGALRVDGSLSGTTTVAFGSTATGSGAYGDVVLNGGTFTPGTLTTTGTVAATTLTINSGSVEFKFSGSSADRLNLTGATNLNNGEISIGQLASVTPGTYVTLTSGSALSGITAGALTTIGRTSYSVDGPALAAHPNQLQIDVTGSPASLKWTGADATLPMQWDDTQTAANWIRTDAGGGDTTHFYDADNVTFDGTNTGPSSLTIVGTVAPGSVTVSAGTYTFGGSGSLAGSGGLLISGTGNLTITNSNTSYSGTITLSSGTLNIANAAALGTGTLAVAGGTFDNTSGGTLTLSPNVAQIWSGNFAFTGTNDLNMGAGQVTLNGSPTVTVTAGNLTVDGAIGNGTGNSFTKSGGGTLILTSASSSYTGGTTINAGIVKFTSFGAFGTGPVSISGGATLDLSSLTATNIAGGFGAKQFTISGAGVVTGTFPGGEGAIFDGGLSQQNAFQKITLATDATIGGNGAAAGNTAIGRYDLRGGTPVLDLAGHTLTKVGSSQFTLVSASATAGNVVVASPGAVGTVFRNTLGIESASSILPATNPDSTPSTITFNDDTNLELFELSGTVTRPMVFNGDVLVSTGTTTISSTLGSPITINGILRVDSALNGANNNAPITLSGNLSGPGSVIKANNNTGNVTGAAVLTLSGNNSYSGGTTITGGTLAAGSNTALGTGPLNVSSGATLDLHGFSPTVGPLSGDSGTITSSVAGAATLAVGSGGGDGSFGGTIQDGSGTVGFTKIGAGTETLTGSNTYTGATQIQGGTLRLGGFGVLSSATTVTLGSGTSSGVLDLAGNNATVAGLTSSGAGAANIVGNSGAVGATLTLTATSGSFGGTIQDVLGSGTATTALTISGGALTLTGANTYTGGTNISGGSTLTVTGSLASTAPVLNSGILSGKGSVGDVTMQIGSSIRPGLTAADGVLGNLIMHSLTVNGGDFRLDLAAGNQSDELIVSGTANFVGSSTITPTSGSPPPGNYLLLTSGSPLAGGTPPTLPTGTRATYTLHFGDATSGPDNVTLNVVGGAKSLTWTGNVPPGSPPGDGTTWDIQNNQNWSDNGGVTTNQTFFNQDSVTFANNSHRSITLNQIVQPAAVTFSNDASNPYTLSGSGAIDGLTGLTVSGGGTVTITNNNTYSGTTAVASGSTLRVADPTVNGGTSGSLGTGPIAVDGTVIFNRSDSVTVPGAISGAGVVQQNGTGTLALSGASSYTGGTVFNSGTVQIAADNNLGGPSGALTFNGGTLEATASFASARGTTINAPGGSFDVDSGATLTMNGIITGGGMLFTTGSGTLVLAASNTMTGGVTIDNGILQVGNAGAFNSTAPNAVAFPANVPSGATLRLNGISVTIGGLSTDPVNPGSAVVDNGSATAATLTVSSSATNTFGGVMQNTGTGNFNLTTTGGGTLVLTGTNTFGGVSTINGSTIQAAVAGNLVGMAGQVHFINGTLHITGDPSNPSNPIIAAATSNKFTTSGTAGSTGTFNIDAGVTFQLGGTSPSVTATTAYLQTAGSGSAGSSFIKTGLGTMIIYGQNNQQDTNFQLQQGTIDLRSARGLGGEDSNAVRLDMSDGTKLILDADAGFNNVTVAPPAGLTGTDFLTGLRSATAGGTINITVDQLTAGSANSQAIGALQAAGAFTMNVTSGPNMTSGAAGLFLDQNNNQTGGGFNGAVTLSGNGTFNVVTNTAAGASGMLMTINGPVVGTGFGIIKTGSGTLQLNSANTYGGATTVSGGTLRLANASVNSIPTSPTISVGSGATFDVTGLTSSTIVLGSGATAQTLTGSGTVTGSLTANAGSAIGGASGGTLTVTGGVSLQDQSHSAFTLGAPNGSGNALTSLVNIAGALSVAGANLVDLSGAAQAGTYELYAFTIGSPTASQFLVSSSSAGAFNYSFSVIPNQEVDLIATPSVSASWNFNGNGNYSESAKWSPATVPNGAGLTATFGNGVPSGTVAPPPSAVTVTIDGVYTLGTLQFNNSASPTSTQYILGNDAVSGHNFTLNNGGLGATVSVAAGVNTQQEILANLVLADNATFNIAGGASLLVSVGSISQSGGNRSLTLTGGGALTIDSASNYGGGTTVTNGTLTTTATGTLGNGPLAINAADTITSSVNLGGSQNVTSLSGTLAGGGTASLSVAAGATLTVNQASTTTYSGNVSLAPSGAAHGGGTLTKSGPGVLEIDGAPSLGANSNLNVSGGTLRFNVTSGSVFVGTGVLATVTGTATLELAGSESALDPIIIKGRADILNNSTASAGVLVSGTNQQVGGIDGAGTTQVNGGSDLTANHIVQGALVIGGDATHAALVTLDASDSNGSPLVASGGGFALAGSLEPSGAFGSGAPSGAGVLASGSSSSGSSLSIAGSTQSVSASVGGSLSAVPEPATFVLLGLGSLVCLFPRLRWRIDA